MVDDARDHKKGHWREGRAAFDAGAKIEDNPHAAGTLAAIFWHHGWRSVRGRGGRLWDRAEAELAS